MRNSTFILFLLLPFFGVSQTLERQVVASGSLQYTNANGSGSATAGQVEYITLEGPMSLTQGFQQPSTTVEIVNETSVELIFPDCLTNESMATMLLSNQICEGESPTVSIDGEVIEAPYQIQISPSVLIFLDYSNDACDTEIDLNTEPVNEVLACGFFIPNLITPNGDGQNDTWSIQNPTELVYELSIMSRWGNVVFSETNFNQDTEWDGNDSNGNSLPSGVYFYVLSSASETFSGTINLLK